MLIWTVFSFESSYSRVLVNQVKNQSLMNLLKVLLHPSIGQVQF